MASSARAASAAIVALLLAGCGSGDGSRDAGGATTSGAAPPRAAAPGAVVTRYYAAAKDPEAKCRTLSQSSQQEFGGFDKCVERTIPSKVALPAIVVTETKVIDDQSCVRFTSPSGGEGIAVLTLEERDWRISAFDSGIEPSHPVGVLCRGNARRERD